MTGKEIQKKIFSEDGISADDSKQIVWIVAMTEDDIESIAFGMNNICALTDTNKEEFMQRLRSDLVAEDKAENKMKKRARALIKKYLSAGCVEEDSDVLYDFITLID